MEKKKYKIVNGKKVRDYSGFGKLGKFTKNLLKVVTRTDGSKTYSKKKLKNIRDNKQDSTKVKKKTINKVNPKQFDNRRIKKIDATQFDGRRMSGMTATERAKAIAKKRIASGKTIAQVKAENTARMKAAAKQKYKAFKAKRNKK